MEYKAYYFKVKIKLNELLSNQAFMIDNLKKYKKNKEYYVKTVTNYLYLHFYCSFIELDFSCYLNLNQYIRKNFYHEFNSLFFRSFKQIFHLFELRIVYQCVFKCITGRTISNSWFYFYLRSKELSCQLCKQGS